MLRRRSRWAIFALLLSMLVSACHRREDEVAARGVRIHRVTLLESQEPLHGLNARFDDWIIESPNVRVLVGGLRRPIEQRGAIVALRAPGLEQEEERGLELTPSVHLENRRYPVRFKSIRALVRDGRAVLRLTGEVGENTDDEDAVIKYEREITLDPRQAGIGTSSRISSRKERARVRLGARVHWGGGDAFVPGEGFVEDEIFRPAPFVAIEGETTATMLARVDRLANIGVVFERHGTERLAQFTEVVDAARKLPARGSLTERSFLAIAKGGMSDALRLVGFLRASPFPEAKVTLLYRPPHTLVRVRSSEGHLVLLGRPNEQGQLRLPIPEFHDSRFFFAGATARGHAGGKSIRFGAGDSFSLDIPRGGRIRVTAVDASTNKPLTARVRFVPLDGAPAVELGPDHSGAGAKDSALLADGTANIPLPKGRFRVLVTRGPEWTMHEEIVEVTNTFQPSVRAELVRVIDPGSYVGCDLHLHASPSPDSRVSLEDRVRSLLAEGVEFALPTDHNHVTDYAETVHALGTEARGFLTTTALEATTWDPAFGHFNAYPVPLRPELPGLGAPDAERTNPADLFARLHELSPETMVQVNHPRSEGGIGYFDVTGFNRETATGDSNFSDDFDVLEVWNGFDLARPDTFDLVFGDYLMMVARGWHVTAVGNSDSHQIRYQWAGYPRTYVDSSAREPSAILEGVRAGKTFVTSGPFLEVSIGDAGPGMTASVVNGAVDVRIRVRTAPFMSVDNLEIYLGATRISSEAISPPRRRRNARAAPSAEVIELTRRVPVARDSAIVVVVRGSKTLDQYFGRNAIPPLAFTSPIWIDADGDGEGPRDPRVRPTRNFGADAGVEDAAVSPNGNGRPRPRDASTDASSEADSGADASIEPDAQVRDISDAEVSVEAGPEED